jgi:hypothetical protein
LHRKFLGDSFDLVKRFWSEALRQIAPLYAHPDFVPSELQAEYSKVTSIPLLNLDKPPQENYGLLLDPDTGIHRSPESSIKKTHVNLRSIVEINKELQPAYLICFDQSFSFQLDRDARRNQMRAKGEFLSGNGIESFYYDSHAPFLFMAGSPDTLAAVRKRLQDLGIPDGRFDPPASHRP